MEEISRLTRLRFQQVRLTAQICAKLSRFDGARSLLHAIGKNDFVAHALLGFNTVFRVLKRQKITPKDIKSPHTNIPAILPFILN